MNLALYKQKKLDDKNQQTYRELCLACRKPTPVCYCKEIKPFHSYPQFVILIHPKENKKRIGTGRLTHLCISNSVLVEGVNFTENEKVNELIQNPTLYPIVLYPGRNAFDLNWNSVGLFQNQIPKGKEPLFIVIDGSWFCAQKMLRISKNLKVLPQVKFTPSTHSIYQIRKQPADFCFSTVESVHYIAEKFSNGDDQSHENLLNVFKFMISQQLKYISRPHQKALRGKRPRLPSST